MDNLSITLLDNGTSLCSKYLVIAKNNARELLLNRKDIIKNYKYKDVSNGKDCDILANITINYPFVHITISVNIVNITKNRYNRSGLSIDEFQNTIEDTNVFSKFYPKNTENGFLHYPDLYNKNQSNNAYGFDKTYLGKNVNQSQYIFGSQFTGEISKQIQYLLGSNDTDIKYRFDWYQTNGIYIDSNNGYWLITIGQVNNLITGTGVYARKIILEDRIDDTIQTKNGVDTPIVNLNLINGIGYQSTDKNLLNLRGFYDNRVPLSTNQGWAFNKKGSKARNISYELKEDIIASTYELSFSEIKNDKNEIIDLTVVSNIVEVSKIPNYHYLTFLQPNVVDNSTIYPENNSVYTYNGSKKGALVKKFFNTPYSISNLTQNYKGCIQTYFDDNDNVKNIYYSFKKEKKIEERFSDSNFLNREDFFKSGYFIEGDLTIINPENENDSGYNFTHGIIVNDDQSNLITDCSGDYTINYEFKVENGSVLNDFAYQVKNNLLDIDLRPFEFFYIDNQSINNIINSFQNSSSNYEDNFKSVSTVHNNNQEYVDYYDIKSQLEHINQWLDKVDIDNSMIRTIPVISLDNIDKIFTEQALNITYPPLLYTINTNIVNSFNVLTNDYLNDVYNIISQAKDLIDNSININQDFYKRNILVAFRNAFIFLKSYSDYDLINKVQLRKIIADINVQINNINSIHKEINLIVKNINDLIGSIGNYFNHITILKNTVLAFNNLKMKNYVGLNLVSQGVSIIEYNGVNRIEEEYFVSNKNFNTRDYEIHSLKNAQFTHFAICYNYSCRNSISVYNQSNKYDDIVKSGAIQKTISATNKFGLYKKTNTYVNNILVNETDYIFLEEVTNYKRFTILDFQGNTLTIDVGYVFLDDGYLMEKYSNTLLKYGNYISLIQQEFSNIPLDYIPYNVTNYKYFILPKKDYNVTYDCKIKTYSNQIIEQDTTIKNDYRLITIPLYFNNSIYDRFNDPEFYRFSYKGDGLIYFNFGKDAYNFEYMVSKNFQSYTSQQDILTNIEKYNIINNKFVNYFGKPFD